MVGMSVQHDDDMLVLYVTDLEFEVDRLRKQARFVEDEVWLALKQMQSLCRALELPEPAHSVLAPMKSTLDNLSKVLIDLHQHPGFHPAHDQVVPIAMRPLANQVFRWHQRLRNALNVDLRLEFEIEHVDWFPARLRHILDSLLGNALNHGASNKGQSRITLGLRRSDKGYELRVTDNGKGFSSDSRASLKDLLMRAAPARLKEMGVGLAVVTALVEQSGGMLTVQSNNGLGACVLVVLPRFDIDDYLENNLDSPVETPNSTDSPQ
jgi:signal transduction histidine kinase